MTKSLQDHDIFFCRNTAGWYFRSIHGAAACEGLQPVSREEYDRLMEKARGPFVIIANKNGAPVLVGQDIVITDDQRLEMRKSRRNALLVASDWTQLPDTLKRATTLKKQWAKYRQELRDLDLEGSDWPISPDQNVADT